MATITQLFTLARGLVDATSTSLPDSLLLVHFNQAGHEITSKLVAKFKKTRPHDLNNSGLPIGTFDLTDNVQKYSFDNSILMLERLEVEGTDGNWHRVNPFDERNVEGSLAEYKKTKGIPEEYAQRAGSIFMYPAPDSTMVTCGAGTNGGKVYYQTGFSDFTSADVSTGTKEPGLPEMAHYLLAYKSVLPYAISYKKDRVPYLTAKIADIENTLFLLESNKDNDKLSRIIPKVESTR